MAVGSFLGADRFGGVANAGIGRPTSQASFGATSARRGTNCAEGGWHRLRLLLAERAKGGWHRLRRLRFLQAEGAGLGAIPGVQKNPISRSRHSSPIEGERVFHFSPSSDHSMPQRLDSEKGVRRRALRRNPWAGGIRRPACQSDERRAVQSMWKVNRKEKQAY
jgi:hypothetical protein